MRQSLERDDGRDERGGDEEQDGGDEQQRDDELDLRRGAGGGFGRALGLARPRGAGLGGERCGEWRTVAVGAVECRDEGGMPAAGQRRSSSR